MRSMCADPVVLFHVLHIVRLLVEQLCMQIGMAARVTPKDNQNHMLLATSQQKPKDLATQLNIKMSNCWAIVRYIVDTCFKMDKESYVLMKDPNKPLMYLYELPSSGSEGGSRAQQGTELPS